MKTVFSRFLKDESGATAIEYSLIAALIFAGDSVPAIFAITTDPFIVISAVKMLGTTLSAKFSGISGNLT